MSSPAMPYSTGAPMLSPAELQKFEAPLIALANLSGGDLRKLLYAFFSFLNRRTDFYCIMPDPIPGGRMGFKEGQAEQILLASFRQFPLRKINPPKGSTATGGNGGDRAAVVKAKASTSLKKDDPKKEVPLVEKKPAKVSADNMSKHTSDNKKDKVNKNDTTTAKSAAKEITPKSDTIRYTDEGKQIPIGNGGSTSRYVWTQTLEEVTVHIPIPEGIRAKDLDVKIGTNSLSICQKGGKNTSSESINANVIPPIEGTLFGKIRPSESTWTLESTSKQNITTLQLILDKYQKTWWSIPLSGDTPLIDTTMVDSTRHIGTYDDETQAEIRRIMHDQRQERLGLPTSSDEMLNDLPPMPTGEKASLPAGVEYIDGETLDKATISDK